MARVIRLLDISHDNLMDQGICLPRKFFTSQVSKVSSFCANTNDDESKAFFLAYNLLYLFSRFSLCVYVPQYIHYVLGTAWSRL